MITHNPLHRSQRAVLPHWAPTSGSDVPTEIGIRMHDARQWEPFILQTGHTFACEPTPLTPSPENTIPQSTYLISERIKFTSVAWHTIISIMSKQHGPQPLTRYRDGILQASPECLFDLPELCLHPFPKGLPKHDILPLLVISHTCVNPRKSKVSGLPSPRCFRFSAANRPNPISRVLSSCSPKLNLQKRSRSSL